MNPEEESDDFTVSATVKYRDGDEIAIRQIGEGVQRFVLIEPKPVVENGQIKGMDMVITASLIGDAEDLATTLEMASMVIENGEES